MLLDGEIVEVTATMWALMILGFIGVAARMKAIRRRNVSLHQSPRSPCIFESDAHPALASDISAAN